MSQGLRVLQWARQHGYSVEWIAEQIGYPHEELAQALNQNRITRKLADALFKRFGWDTGAYHKATLWSTK